MSMVGQWYLSVSGRSVVLKCQWWVSGTYVSVVGHLCISVNGRSVVFMCQW